MCVCTDSSFQINLPVWHTLCLTGEACHPASSVYILILVRRADLPFTPSTAKPFPSPPLSTPFLYAISTSLTPFSPLIPSFCHSVLYPSLSFPLSPRHTKLSWSHYFEEKWSADMEEGRREGGVFLFLSHIQIFLFFQDHFSFPFVLWPKYK